MIWPYNEISDSHRRRIERRRRQRLASERSNTTRAKPPCYQPVELPLPSEQRKPAVKGTAWVTVAGAVLGSIAALAYNAAEIAGYFA